MALSLKLPAPPSDEEIIEISRRNPGFKFERTAAGELLVTPAGGEAGWQELELCRQLGDWARTHGGKAFSPSTGFRMPDGSLFLPDASWVRQERWDSLTAQERRGFPRLCPDAVFEVRSWTDNLADLRAKMRSYIANGARLALLIDPERRAVEIYPTEIPRSWSPPGRFPVSLPCPISPSTWSPFSPKGSVRIHPGPPNLITR